MPRRMSSLAKSTDVAVDRDINSKYDVVKVVADHIENVDTLATSVAKVVDVSDNMADVVAVAAQDTNISVIVAQVVPNMAEILLADDNASIATVKAEEARVSAAAALASEITITSSAEQIAIDTAAIAQLEIDKEPKNSNIQSHISSTGNPHATTKAQVGLGLVDNTADADKVVASAGKLTTTSTIALTGDVTGTVNFDGSSGVSIATTIAANSVALGTDTTGNYMVNVTAGSGISVSHTQGEGSTATITNSAPNITTDITTTHTSIDVVVNSSDGTDGTINSATQMLAGVMSAADKTKLDGIEAGATGDQTASEILTLLKTVDGSGSGVDADLLDGQEGAYYLNASNINTGTINDSYLPGTITSDITGNAATATKLATAKTISLTGDVTGDVSFDGNANVSITTTVADDSHNHVISNVDGLQTALDSKANQSNTYTKTEVDNVVANDSAVVHKTGDETIAGIKTFNSSPIVPTPTTDFQATTARSTNITVDVGAGQTYTTINQALEYLSGFYPLHKTAGVTATINLKAGFVMNEQVLVRGLNLGWITIVGEDDETIITHTALTTDFYGNYPAFGVDKGGTSPVIGQLFRFNVEKVKGNKHGLMTQGAGSSADLLTDTGFIGAGTNGIVATEGSTINAQNADASNAGTNGIVAVYGAIINADGANASNAGTNGIVAVYGAIINADGANASNAGTTGIIALYGATINAEEANASNAGTNGIVADSSSTINAQNADASSAGDNGIVADSGSTINAVEANASNAGTNGIVADSSSTINAQNADASSAGDNGIVADGGSTINADRANASSAGDNGIVADGGSTINADRANASNAGDTGIVADGGSTINAVEANASNAGDHGIVADGGSTINADRANASNAGDTGIVADGGSTINAVEAIIQNQTTGSARVVVVEGSHIVAIEIDTTGGTVPALSQTANTLTAQGIIYQ